VSAAAAGLRLTRSRCPGAAGSVARSPADRDQLGDGARMNNWRATVSACLSVEREAAKANHLLRRAAAPRLVGRVTE